VDIKEGRGVVPQQLFLDFFDDMAATGELEFYLFDQIVKVKLSPKI